MTSDSMSIDSSSTVSIVSVFDEWRHEIIAHTFIHSQSTDYKEISTPKSEDMVDDDGLRNSLSADDSNDLFFEDSGEYSPGINHTCS